MHRQGDYPHDGRLTSPATAFRAICAEPRNIIGWSDRRSTTTRGGGAPFSCTGLPAESVEAGLPLSLPVMSESEHEPGHGPIDGRAVADLTPVVVAPAHHSDIVRPTTVVMPPRDELDHFAEVCHPRRNCLVGGSAVAELARDALSPARDGVRLSSTSVVPDREPENTGQIGDRSRCQSVHEGAVTELLAVRTGVCDILTI